MVTFQNTRNKQWFLRSRIKVTTKYDRNKNGHFSAVVWEARKHSNAFKTLKGKNHFQSKILYSAKLAVKWGDKETFSLEKS